MRRLGALIVLCFAFSVSAATAEIVGARYDGPTDRYPHGVLGDAIEHDTLSVTLADGRVISARWDAPLVFEDTQPRLADLDGDGAPEIITVESHASQGARLAIWGLRNDALTPLASTPFIGTRFRWLAPLGAADLDGDGVIELAYIDRPHLAKTLRVWRYVVNGDGQATLVPVADKVGLTNHRIGEVDIAGGIRDCGAGPEVVTADAGWSRLIASTLSGDDISSRDIGPHRDRSSFRAALACE